MRIEGTELMQSAARITIGLTVGLALGAGAQAQAALGAKLTPSDGTAGDHFGYSVAIAGDTAIMGAPGDDPQGAQSGSAYVYTRVAGTWSLEAKLSSDDGVGGASFGQQVAVSGDTAIVGAPYALSGGVIGGAVYVFVRSGTAWTQQAKLVASDPHALDYFGSAISLDGSTAVVGAPYADVFGVDSGAAYVFTRTGLSWTQQAKIVPTEGRSGDLFGASLSLKSDTVGIGAPNDDDNAIASGSLYVFVRGGTSWGLQQKLHPPDGANGDLFGTAVAMGSDTVVVGAPDRDEGGLAAGAAYVFVRSGILWSSQQKLTAHDASAGDFFGSAVALSENRAVVGAFLDDDGPADTGSAYSFERVGANWIERERLSAPDRSAGDSFAAAVAVDGTAVLIGVDQDDDRGNASGSAYLGTLGPAPTGVPALGEHAPVAVALLLGLGAWSLGAPRARRRMAAPDPRSGF